MPKPVAVTAVFQKMKKVLSTIIAAALSVSIWCVPVHAHTTQVNNGDTLQFNKGTQTNAFGDLTNWTGIIFGDTENIVDVEGTIAVGGNFNSGNGFSANGGAYGASPASTEDISLLVNGNININGYGSVWGQTVIGKKDGNNYRLSNITPSKTTNGEYVVADSTQYFADAKDTAYSVKSIIESLPVNGVCKTENDIYTFVGDSSVKTLVYNVENDDFNRYLFDFSIADGQIIIVNLTTSNKISMKYGGVKINGSMDPDYLRSYNRNIVFNVVNSSEINMTSTELYGILLAPDTNLYGSGANICGTTIINNLTGSSGFELHVGSNNSFIPNVYAPTATPSDTAPDDPSVVTPEEDAKTVNIRIDVPLKMAVAFEDGSIYYGGETKNVIVGQEYHFQMCAVNWENGVYDGKDNGLCGTVVYTMVALDKKDFDVLAREAAQHPERYTVKGIDIIDNETKKIIINCDAQDTHLETDVNNFFVAYRFHFASHDYKKKTGIEKVINTPIESLSVNLPKGSIITCNAYIDDNFVGSDKVFITTNSGEGIYENKFLTSVNDYTWNYN